MEDGFLQLTPRAQQLLRNAEKESANLKHQYIGTEHLLLAILELPDSTAFQVLIPDVVPDPTTLRHRVLSRVEKQSVMEDSLGGNRVHTPRVKKVFALAEKQAQKVEGLVYTGTEHILLAMIIEGDGIAGRVLVEEYGLTEEKTRQMIKKIKDPLFQEDKAGLSEEEFVEASIQILQLPTEGLDEKLVVQIKHLKHSTLATLIYRKSPVKGNHQFLVALRTTVGEATDLETIKHSAVLVQAALNGTAETVVRSAFVTQVRGTQAEKNLGTLLQLVTNKPVAVEVVDYLKLWES